jgi:molybdenum cofactor cytidylyltransferase
VGPVVVVLGAAAQELRFELSDLGVRIAENASWRDGMSASIRVGLDELEAATEPDAVLFTTCDQPLVTPEILKRLAESFAATRPPAVACEYAGTLGVPALFERALFAELRRLSGDQGAKPVIDAHRRHVLRVPFEDAALDIDTPEDARRLPNDGR